MNTGRDDTSPLNHRHGRRAVLRAAVCVGLALPLAELCPRVARDAAAQGGDPKSQRPQAGDRFAFQSGERAGQRIAVADLEVGGPPVAAYPMDARSGVVRDGSRLNQLLLVRFAPADLTDEARSRSAEGIVAFSAVCTHTGCDLGLWKPETRRLRCPCHESEFDPRDSGRVVGGPAPRRLPRLPVRVVDGVPEAAGSFIGRPGFQPG